jgi:hypothetical protein
VPCLLAENECLKQLFLKKLFHFPAENELKEIKEKRINLESSDVIFYDFFWR